MLANVNGTTLWYDTLGNGPPLMLLHGGPGLDHTEFRPWLDPLADQFTLIFVDERGTGRSARVDPATATTDTMVADVEALRQHLGYERMALLGFSFGGFLALGYVARYAQHLTHLVLANTAPSLDFEDVSEPLLRSVMTPEIEAAMQREPLVTDDEEFRAILAAEGPIYYKSWTPREQAMWNEFCRQTIVGRDVMGWWSEHERPHYDQRPILPQIAVPTLVIAGRHDRVTPVGQAETMARAIPGARFEIFEDSGHMTINEEQDHFLALLREFLVFHNSHGGNAR